MGLKKRALLFIIIIITATTIIMMIIIVIIMMIIIITKILAKLKAPEYCLTDFSPINLNVHVPTEEI